MIAIDVPTDVLGKAHSLVVIAESVDAENVTEMIAAWIREGSETFAQVVLALALMADKDKVLKQGHSAYNRGERSPTIVDLERRYQVPRKRKARAYLRGEVSPDVA